MLSCQFWQLQVLGEIMEQEGATIFNGARYKPLPAIAQARMTREILLRIWIITMSVSERHVKTDGKEHTLEGVRYSIWLHLILSSWRIEGAVWHCSWLRTATRRHARRH